MSARSSISQPIAFAPWNPRELVAAFQFVMTSIDGGAHWVKISPDLGYPKDTVPTPDSLRGKPGLLVGGTIQSMALSPVKRGEIWVGTNTSLIKLTQDEGKTWQDVSIPNQPGDVLAIEASHFDAGEAYVVFSWHASGDFTPYVYRTRDYGKTWTLITNGFATGQPSGSFARVVREDPKTRGLLFAGTESGMYVSFDDGDHWQPLQLNLPNTSCRDVVIHGNDLVLGTYGRGIWVLDDISALRQIQGGRGGNGGTTLFAPGEAVRVRRNVGNDTPFPPEVPHALNPPDGAIIYYSLATKPAEAITLDVLDAAGTVVRHMTSGPVEPVKEAARPPEPNFWIAPPFQLPAVAGGNRTNWDLRADAPPAFTHTFEINANPGLTLPSPMGPLVPPGAYTLRLTVDGKTYSQPITVVNDPRSPATAADVRAQYALETRVVAAMQAAWEGYQRVAATQPLDSTLVAVGGDPAGGRGFGGFRPGGPPPPTFVGVNGTLGRQLNALETGDLAPTPAMQAAYAVACKDLAKAVTTFNAVVAQHQLTQAPLAAPRCGG
ncbi:MAG: hypothetical protein DMD66_10390 [Gemmatimonadetes bacterium]|nr:MAG: hypothetical protein DMD66_10390 [Gemmatimonadota bacterium]